MYKAFTVPLSRSKAIRRWSSNYNTWRIGGGGGGGDGGGVVANAITMVTTLGAIRTIGGSAKAGIRNGVPPVPVPLLGPGLGRRARAISSCAVVQQQRTNESDLDQRGGTKTSAALAKRAMAQSQSPRPIGVAAALAERGGAEIKGVAAAPTLWDEFALGDRVAIVSGANRGLGLEMALVLIEAGARAVYCVDLPAQPGNEWVKVAKYVKRTVRNGGRLEYVSADVRDQKRMWKVAEEIGDREGRMDVCVAAAGILKAHTDCLEYPAEEFEEVRVCAWSYKVRID
jgi:short chain dehydrogenase